MIDSVLERYFKNKVVFVTGAGSGLGQSLSLVLAGYGAKLVLTDKNEIRLKEVCDIVKTKTDVVSMPLDIRNREEFSKLKDKVPKDWFVEIAIANAGVGGLNPADYFSPEIDETIMSINYFGLINSLTLFLSEMKSKHKGHLVGISSLASIRGLPGASSYSASKAAVNNLLESWRLDLAPYGINVSTIRPGFIKTPMTNHDAFPLPFMVNSEKAAKLTLLAIAKNTKVYAYPWPMALLSLLNKYLPVWAYDFILPKLNPKDPNHPQLPRIF